MIVVIQKYLLNFIESLQNQSLNTKNDNRINNIGITAIHKTLRNATLSNISTIFVSINNQSNDRNTPEDFPAFCADVRRPER